LIHSSNSQRIALCRWVLVAAIIAAAVFTWSALCKVTGIEPVEKGLTTMAMGSLKDAVNAGMAESDRQNAAKSQGNKENKGSNKDGVPYLPNGPKTLKTIPDVEDSPIVNPEPIDLTPLTTPARRPLRDVAIGGQYAQAGITGYAGVFVP
jgi:hypothetical protein